MSGDAAELLYVVSDSGGYVGTFLSAAAAEAAVIRKYPVMPFLLQRFPVAPGPVDAVWVVLYRDLDAVAFVSNDRAEAARVQSALANVGLTYPDAVDHWEQPVGALARAASGRLEAQARACAQALGEEALRQASEADRAYASALGSPRGEGPIARLLRENELVTIFDAVVPTACRGGAEDTSAEDTSAGDTPIEDIPIEDTPIEARAPEPAGSFSWVGLRRPRPLAGDAGGQ